MQFEREDKQSVQKKVADLIQKYGLTALAAKPDIQPYVQEALAKVRYIYCMSTKDALRRL